MDIMVVVKYLIALFNLFYIPFCCCFIVYFIKVGKKQKAELKKLENHNKHLEDLYTLMAEIRLDMDEELKRLKVLEQDPD